MNSTWLGSAALVAALSGPFGVVWLSISVPSYSTVTSTFSNVGLISFRASLTTRFNVWAKHGTSVHSVFRIAAVILLALSLTQHTTSFLTFQSFAVLRSSPARLSAVCRSQSSKQSRRQEMILKFSTKWHVTDMKLQVALEVHSLWWDKLLKHSQLSPVLFWKGFSCLEEHVLHWEFGNRP